MTDFLHIYGQEENHHPVFIVGSRKDLYDLMVAINKALYFPTQSHHYTSDGEGFRVNIVALDKPEYDKQAIQLPYYSQAEYIQLPNKNKLRPDYLWKMIRKYFGLEP